MKKKFTFFILLLISCVNNKATNSNEFYWKNFIETQRNYEDLINKVYSIPELQVVKRISESNFKEEIWITHPQNYLQEDSTSFFWIYVNRFSESEWNVDMHFTEHNIEHYLKNIENIERELDFLGEEFFENCNCIIKTFYYKNNIFVEYFQSKGKFDKKDAYHILIHYS